MKITKNNRMLPKFQTGGTISNNAINFTAGFENNRGYGNAGYTSDPTRNKNSMAGDYGNLIQNLPEPLQVLMLDTYHNQSNPLGTALFALHRNDKKAYNEFIKTHGQQLGLTKSNTPTENMQALSKVAYNDNAIYNGGVNQDVAAIINDYVTKSYDKNPNKFIRDYTSSRVQRYTTFGAKNDQLGTGQDGSKGEEWMERSIAVGKYAQDLKDGNAQPAEYYFDSNLNGGVFKQMAEPLLQFSNDKYKNKDNANYFNKIDRTFQNLMVSNSITDKDNNTFNKAGTFNEWRGQNDLVDESLSPEEQQYSDEQWLQYEVEENREIVKDQEALVKQYENDIAKSKATVKPTPSETIPEGFEETHFEIRPEELRSYENQKPVLQQDGTYSYPENKSQLKPNHLDKVKQFFQIESTGNNIRPNKFRSSNKTGVKDVLSNLLRKDDANPYKDVYEDDQKVLQDTRDEIKDMNYQNRAERKESRLQNKDYKQNAILNRKADTNIYLKDKQNEMNKLNRSKSFNRDLKNIDKLHNKISKMRNRFEKKNKFQFGGYKDHYNLNVDPTIDLGVSSNFAGTVPNLTIPTTKSPTQPIGSKTTNVESNYNPYKLSVYGNKMSENAINGTTAFNVAQQMAKPRYNPLFAPKNVIQRQYATSDFTDANQQEQVARKGIAQNTRSSSSYLANLNQLASNMTKAKSKIARDTQVRQKQYDSEFNKYQQDRADMLTNAKLRKEMEDRADYGAKQQALSDTITQREKGEREKAKLYNAELLNHNQKEYVNQLSNEYKAITGPNGVVSIVFAKTGKIDPQKTAQVQSAGVVKTYESGGKTVGNKPKIIKRLRNRLYN